MTVPSRLGRVFRFLVITIAPACAVTLSGMAFVGNFVAMGPDVYLHAYFDALMWIYFSLLLSIIAFLIIGNRLRIFLISMVVIDTLLVLRYMLLMYGYNVLWGSS